ncbi:MAG: hypothetical protein IAE95_00175, partial [Chitinophagaceae bacterium]|nr:hypothetical protein [Chitinophagaceae bacterium]
MKKYVMFLSFLLVAIAGNSQVSVKRSTTIRPNGSRSIFVRQPDGKLLYFTATEGRFFSGRLFANGENDDAYNGARSSRQLFEDYYNCSTRAVTIDKWNRVLFCGAASIDSIGAPHATLSRYGRNGDPDNDFLARVQQIKVGDSSYAAGIAVLPDEKILVAGSCFSEGRWTMFLSRLQYNGDKETSFGSGGVITDNSIPGNTKVSAVCLQADGKLLIAAANENGGVRTISLTRYYADGTRDTLFGIGGSATMPADKMDLTDVSHMGLQSDGRVIVGGTCRSPEGRKSIYLASFTSWGVPDTAFGRGTAVATIAPYHENSMHDMLILPGGKIMVSGAGRNAGEGENSREVLLRFSKDGNVDPQYGYGTPTGFGMHFFANGYVPVAHNIALAASEWKIYRLSELNELSGKETLLTLTTFLLDTSLGVIDVPNRKVQYHIYPVPIRNAVRFSFDLVDDQKVSARLLDKAGKPVVSFAEGKVMEEGENSLEVKIP